MPCPTSYQVRFCIRPAVFVIPVFLNYCMPVKSCVLLRSHDESLCSFMANFLNQSQQKLTREWRLRHTTFKPISIERPIPERCQRHITSPLPRGTAASCQNSSRVHEVRKLSEGDQSVKECLALQPGLLKCVFPLVARMYSYNSR